MDTIIDLGKVTEETKGGVGDRYEASVDECEFPDTLAEIGTECP